MTLQGMTTEPTERHNHDLARRACLARLERSIDGVKSELARLRAKHGKSAIAALTLDRMEKRRHFLLMNGDPFMRVFS